jgi:serine/threonine-protein kinase
VSHQGPQQVVGVVEGQLLAGKYRVERVLGVGGMGVVVAAHHIGLNEKVAIKVLLPELAVNPMAVGLFAREARAAVRIKSENVVRVLDVGTLETGAPYMVMEYLEGSDLSAWVQRGPLPVKQAVDFVIQTCVAIAEAHGLGIVHRDLKPSNLFCVRGADGRLSIKVLDFGISKVTDAVASGLTYSTRTGALLGSPRYMSPEQMQSAKAVDGRTDIWSLGIILYELLTGHRPFDSESIPEIIVRIVTHTPLSMRALRSDVPEGLESVFGRCTEKDRDQRYGNVAELAVALLPYAPRSSNASVEKITSIIKSSGLSMRTDSAPPSSLTVKTPIATRWSLGTTTRPSGVKGLGPNVGPLNKPPARDRSWRPPAILVAAALAACAIGATVMALRPLRQNGRQPSAPANGISIENTIPTAKPTPSQSLTAIVPATASTTWHVAAEPKEVLTVTSDKNPPVAATTLVPPPAKNRTTISNDPKPQSAASQPQQSATSRLWEVASEPKGVPTITSDKTPPAAATTSVLPPAKNRTTISNDSKPGSAASQPQQPEGRSPPDCSPPYTVDDKGHKHFKPTCVN